ncbi:MAG: hypothetical protein NT015_13230 [Alphaproteobacteria bacterium]|nr:hypothetical protein [Alphaproteobacteria bacterium]
MDFAEDAKVQQVAEAYALDAIAFARKNFKVELDFSDASIAQIESMMENFDRNATRGLPRAEVLAQFGKMFGSYIGEVYRKNHGGSWGMITNEGSSIPGVQGADGTLFWPWARVENRMRQGPQENILDYYLYLLGPAQ